MATAATAAAAAIHGVRLARGRYTTFVVARFDWSAPNSAEQRGHDSTCGDAAPRSIMSAIDSASGQSGPGAATLRKNAPAASALRATAAHAAHFATCASIAGDGAVPSACLAIASLSGQLIMVCPTLLRPPG